MTTPEAITSEIQKLEPSAIIELFELDATAFGGDLLRFHAGTNGLRQNLVWQGNTYTAFPVNASGFDMSGNGQLPRPKLQVANVTGAITLLVLTYDDLLGAKVTRKRTLAKYLDAVNFRKDNLLLWSEDITKTSYFATQVTKNTFETATLLSTSDPGIGQLVTGLGSIQNRTFSFGISAKGSGSSVGKYLRMFMYSQTIDEVRSISVGPLASNYQPFTFTGSFFTSTNTGINFRIDMEGTPSWLVGENLSITNWQANEGATLNGYQKTGATWNPTADAMAEFPDDVFFIDRKVTETRDLVEFELAAAFDVAGVQLPRRQIIQNVCVWRYRGGECGYTGTNYFDANDVPVVSAGLDVCGKRLSSCEARFGVNPLPFGSFPAAGLTR